MTDRLGGTVARRPLHFIWVLDVSGSMAHDGKIQALNNAIAETIPLLAEDAAANAEAELLVRAMTFATAPVWAFPDPTPVERFRWQPVTAVHQGLTELGLAVNELVPVMRALARDGRGFAPAIVLVSDGQPTSLRGPSLESALEDLNAEPWGRASVRVAVGIGRDASMEALSTFIGNSDLSPVRADNPEELVGMIQWVSRMVSRIASTPAGGKGGFEPPARDPALDHVWDVPTR
jgi:uncharacterized protein YegL